MGRPKKPQNSKSNVVPMNPEAGGNVAVAEPEPETETEQVASPAEQPAPANIPPPRQKSPGFFQRVAEIPKLDWGTRAFIYVYCLEPLCDLRRGRETKYLVRLGEPIEDENSLMMDYGSGKYRLQLVYRKPGATKSDAVDSVEIEIYNPKYPPKIPRDIWLPDRRNERWAALLPKEQPTVSEGLGTMTEAFKAFKEIRKDLQSDMAPPPAQPEQNKMGEFAEMITAVKSILPTTGAATVESQMSGTLQLVQTIMAMKADNPMAEIYKLELQSLRDEMKAEREENRRLQKEMNDRKTGEDANGLEAIIEKFEKIAPKLQSLLGLGGEKLTDVVHGRRRPWYEELALSAVPQLTPSLNTLISNAANYFMARPAGLGATPATATSAFPAPNGQPAAQDPLEPLRQKVGAFLGANIGPLQKRFEAFVKGTPRDPDNAEYGTINGEDFALWVYEEHGNQILQDARSLGSANIRAMFQHSPYWVAIQPHEAKFMQFLDQVLAFTPDEEDKDEGKPVDLTEEK
jgi:hypothetical protein